jgi:hypothetical protein
VVIVLQTCLFCTPIVWALDATKFCNLYLYLQ